MAKPKADMQELSCCNAAETGPRTEASNRPSNVRRKSQLISTSHQEVAVDGDPNPSGVHPVQSTYNLVYNEQISGANHYYVHNDTYYSNV